MSMNLYVVGTRKAEVHVKGKTKSIIDETEFDLWQTPTKLTCEVLALPTLDQRVEAYIKWADSVCSTKDVAQDHINSLYKWLRMCEAEDYQVEFYML